MIEAERIEHAPEPVVEVHTECDVGDDVERAHPPHLKSGHEVVVDVALDEVRMELAERQMAEVVENEQQDDDAAPAHRPRRVGGGDVIASVVADRARFPVHDRELRGRLNVQPHRDQ